MIMVKKLRLMSNFKKRIIKSPLKYVSVVMCTSHLPAARPLELAHFAVLTPTVSDRCRHMKE